MAMGPGTGKRYKGRTTPFVVMTCIVAASGGALFGYDNGEIFASMWCHMH